jgi:hypothetical protein
MQTKAVKTKQGKNHKNRNLVAGAMEIVTRTVPGGLLFTTSTIVTRSASNCETRESESNEEGQKQFPTAQNTLQHRAAYRGVHIQPKRGNDDIARLQFERLSMDKQQTAQTADRSNQKN